MQVIEKSRDGLENNGEFSEIFLSELAAVIESSRSCKRGRSKVEIPVLENLLKLVAAKSTRVCEIVKELMAAYRECFMTINRCRKQSTMSADPQQIPLCEAV